VANRALELIGKELGMFLDRQKVEITGALSVAETLRAARARRTGMGTAEPLPLPLPAA
jgi:hypothetical protein